MGLDRQLNAGGSALTTVLITVVMVSALYFGREVLVPIALAVLLSFVLAPPVRLMESWRVPRGLAVVVVVLIAFAAISGLGALMVSQVNQLASDLPQYQATLRGKIQSLRGAAAGTGTLERASEVLQELGKKIDKPTGGPRRPVSPPANERAVSPKPIPVEVRQPDPGALQTIVALITPLIRPLTMASIVVIFARPGRGGGAGAEVPKREAPACVLRRSIGRKPETCASRFRSRTSR